VRQRRRQLVVADAADQHDVDAIDRQVAQRREQLGRVGPGGGDAVGDEHDAAIDAAARAGDGREQLAEIRRAGGAALEQRQLVRLAEAGGAAVEDGLRVLIERDHLQLDGIAVTRAQLADQATDRAHVGREAERA
jgi:hypothetical protein